MGKRPSQKQTMAEPVVLTKNTYPIGIWSFALIVGIFAFVWMSFSESNSNSIPASDIDYRLTANGLLDYANMTATHRNKRFRGDSLGFVTPWNGKGTEFAQTFAKKFTMISPVWYQIAPGNVLTGSHHYDRSWLEGLRQNQVRILPRFNLEGWQWQDVLHLLQNPKAFSRMVLNEIQKSGYDGIVLEATQAMLFADHLSNSMKSQGVPSFGESVLASLYNELQPLGKQIIVVVSPNSDISKHSAITLYGKYVSHLVIMTYDFWNDGRIGPNAPLAWVKETVDNILSTAEIQPKQLLLGLNFYGIDHKGRIGQPRTSESRAVTAHDIIQLLGRPDNKIQPLTYLETEKEHLLRYFDSKGEEHSVFYPTLQSIQERLLLAENLGIGVQVWELGQGFECFFNLF